MAERPKPQSSMAEKELQKCDAQFQAYDENVKSLTHDRLNQAPKLEQEPIHKIAQSDISNAKDIYLKSKVSIPSQERFNENYREEYNFAKEYVYFIAEHREIIGEIIEVWTKPFAGMPAEFWNVPTGKPIWAPRYVAERIKGCNYRRLVMQDNVTQNNGIGTFYGQLAVDTTIQRLDALPATKTKSLFMGAVGF